MKNPPRILYALAAFGAATVAAHAQPAFKLLVVDMEKLYNAHYKTIEQNTKLQADNQKAEEEVARLNTEGNALVEEYKSLNEQATNNPALTPEAKAKAASDAQKKYEAIQAKQNEVRTYMNNVRGQIQQRMANFRNLQLEDISKTATEVAKK